MPRIDRESRAIAAPPARLWQALADPAAIARRMPPPGMTGEAPLWDLRPGGRWRIVLRYNAAGAGAGKTDAATDLSEGRFLAVDPGRRIVQEVAFVSDDPGIHGTMRMTLTLTPDGAGTRVAVTAENVPEGIDAAAHAEGMAGKLANLARWSGG